MGDRTNLHSLRNVVGHLFATLGTTTRMNGVPPLAFPVPVLLPSATRLGNQTTRPSGS